MNWPFLTVVFSGWLYIDAIYRGPAWQKWLFKPITLILLLLWIWQAPDLSLRGYLTFAALLLSLSGDALLALFKDKLPPAIGAYFACYLLYTVSFATPPTFAFHLPFLLGVAAAFAAVIALIWPALEDMRWPVLIYYSTAALMVWVAGEHYFSLGDGARFSALAGSLLLWVSTSCWLLNLYRVRWKAADAIIACSYFLGHFMVVRSLHIVEAVSVAPPA